VLRLAREFLELEKSSVHFSMPREVLVISRRRKYIPENPRCKPKSPDLLSSLSCPVKQPTGENVNKLPPIR